MLDHLMVVQVHLGLFPPLVEEQGGMKLVVVDHQEDLAAELGIREEELAEAEMLEDLVHLKEVVEHQEEQVEVLMVLDQEHLNLTVLQVLLLVTAVAEPQEAAQAEEEIRVMEEEDSIGLLQEMADQEE